MTPTLKCCTTQYATVAELRQKKKTAMTDNLSADIYVKFRFNNICSQEDLDEDGWTLEELIRFLIKEEGLMGIVDDELSEILKIEEVNDD